MAKLTPAERAILINQFKILGAIEGDLEAYSSTIDVLSRGYELDYADHVDGLDEPLSEENCRFVQDVLFLYYLMKLARNREAVDSPGGDREPDGSLRMAGLEPKFPGFDGNSSDRYYAYAKFLIETEGKFPEHKHYLNSHGSPPNYRAMLNLHNRWGRPTDLTDAQVDELLEAGR